MSLPLDPNAKYCTCPICNGSGFGQGDNTYCGYCGGDGSVPEWAYLDHMKKNSETRNGPN